MFKNVINTWLFFQKETSDKNQWQVSRYKFMISKQTYLQISREICVWKWYHIDWKYY